MKNIFEHLKGDMTSSIQAIHSQRCLLTVSVLL